MHACHCKRKACVTSCIKAHEFHEFKKSMKCVVFPGLAQNDNFQKNREAVLPGLEAVLPGLEAVLPGEPFWRRF